MAVKSDDLCAGTSDDMKVLTTSNFEGPDCGANTRNMSKAPMYIRHDSG